MKFLSLIFSKSIYIPFSYLITLILKIKGLKIGKNLYIEGVPNLKIRGNPSNIIIGKNVKIFGYVDLRNRENGQIHIKENVSFDTNTRLVAANNAKIEISSGTEIGPYCIFNCGEDVFIGKDTLFSGFCYVQSSNHGIKKGKVIKHQKHTYGKITIGDGVWIGSNVTILPGVSIGNGAVIAAKSVVNKNVMENEIFAGVPAKKISERK